ncbi:hypothetical protein QQF64_002953 [Cirrhinus molitorella]|uniref:Uncharacterized protein n=1 Tax=Cirrhinus molitorella TaxID=172907 RepID=A0ABR3MK71_9TELE
MWAYFGLTLAQSVECSRRKREVAGSMPAFSKRVPALLQSLSEPDGLRLLRSEATLVAPAFGAHCREKGFQNGPGAHSWQKQVPLRFELRSLDSESRVLTITPWNRDESRRRSQDRKE